MTDQETAQRFANILQDALMEIDPTITFSWKRMFGGAGYFVNGTIFAAWFREASIALKLPEAEREELLQMGGLPAMMRQYVEVPQSFLTDIVLLAEWIGKSIEYVTG